MLTFTGTADQITWKQKIHDVLVRNELGGNTNLAFALSFAGSRSGYSFGYAQWDLATNSTVRNTTFLEILQNATDANGQFIIHDDDPTTGRTNDTLIQTLMNQVGLAGGNSLTTLQRNLIDQALSSVYGQNTIDQRHDQHVGEVLVRVDQVIAMVADSIDNAFLKTDVPKLFLADYENQSKISPGGALERFLQRQPATLGGGRVQQVGRLGVDDLLNLYFATDYARTTTGLNDELRRFTNVVSVAGGFSLSADPAAREEEAKGLIRVYQDYLKAKQFQLTRFTDFNASVLKVARDALIAQYVIAPGIGILIDGEVVVGEDATSHPRNTKHFSEHDLFAPLIGAELNDLILGESGSDELGGAGGNDVLYGGTGNDVLVGGLGNDYLDGTVGRGAQRPAALRIEHCLRMLLIMTPIYARAYQRFAYLPTPKPPAPFF